MIEKVLIANRGEIALRIIWACRELGLRTVAVHSTADRDSLHVRFADEDVCIGPARSADSYLNISAIIAAAEITGADAIHPGYGFLAESAHFAEVCADCGITFIGPPPEVIRRMGDKAEARRTMIEAGVPVLPGSEGALESLEAAEARAGEIGYPVILKASAGGGGRGMRIVRGPDDLRGAYLTAENEAESAFGTATLYLEKYLDSPRHIEFQVFGDAQGNVVHLNERECSIQRRHQKLIEEAPSPALDAALRARMGEAAVKAARAVDYVNAGTVEFLLADDGTFTFMEMNTRIQVEHPVTENVTGLDLIKLQLAVAGGAPLPFGQKDVNLVGHSMECRINAEDPWRFTPCPGRITSYHPPGGPGIRVDTAAHADAVVSPHYDSLIAKLIARGNSRREVIGRMLRALESFVVEGIKTNLPLQAQILRTPEFQSGEFDTGFLDRFLAGRAAAGSPSRAEAS